MIWSREASGHNLDVRELQGSLLELCLVVVVALVLRVCHVSSVVQGSLNYIKLKGLHSESLAE